MKIRGIICFIFISILFFYHVMGWSNTSIPPKTIKHSGGSAVSNIEGELEIRAALYLKEHKDVIQYILKTNNGIEYHLHFYDPLLLDLKTGQRIRIKHAYQSTAANNIKQLYFYSRDIMIIQDVVKTALPNTLGPQKTFIFLVNFQDQPRNYPWTAEQAKEVTLNSVSKLYSEASYQQTTVVGNAAGWYTVPMDSTSTDCETITRTIVTTARAGAAKDGIDLSSYTHHVFLFPSVPSCLYAGLSTVGGNPSSSWLNGYNTLYVSGHELGHALGLFHSGLMKCEGAPNQGHCENVEYGDRADIMGYWENTSHFNAFQKWRLGWLNDKNSPPIQLITAPGTYTIAPYEIANNQIKALQIPYFGKNFFYFVEYRQPIGFDSNLNCATCDYTKGVIIHSANIWLGNSSSLLKMNGADPNDNAVALLPGQSFHDSTAANGGVTITANSISPAGASVTVNFGNSPTCTHKAPGFYIYPPSTSVVAGKNAYYKAQLVNNDDISCPSTTFNLSLSIPGNLKGSLDNSSLTVAPGTYANAALQINTTTATPANAYSIRVLTTHPNIPNSNVTANGILTVKSACTPALPSVEFNPTSQSGKPGESLQYNVTITNRDTGNACSTSLFGVGVLPPLGFSSKFSDDFPPIQPGKSASQYLTVTSGKNTVNGAYNIVVSATSVQSGLKGIGQGQYNVKN